MTITIRLTKEQESRLNALAERTGRTKSFYVRTAVDEYLEDIEDAYAGDQAVRRFRADGSKARPATELIKELGITPEEWQQAERDLHESGEW